MIGDIRPPQKRPPNTPLPRPSNQTKAAPSVDTPTPAPPTSNGEATPVLKPPSPPRLRILWIVLGAIFLILLVGALFVYGWYGRQLQPVNPYDTSSQTIEITQQTTFDHVSSRLKERNLIRSKLAFEVNAWLSGKQNQLKVGACQLKPSQSSQEILENLTGDCASEAYKAIMFYPGATIEKPLFKSAHASSIDPDKMYVKGILERAGYNSDEIKEAFNKEYRGDLFKGKPKNSSLEGYIFGETYHISPDATVETVLETSFREMERVIRDNNIEEGFKKQGLTLYEGITLASIVQRELNCEDKPTPERKERCYQYQRQIAQVFHKRLSDDISLGSDPTFIYGADLLRVPPTVDLDSPYNTRIHKGLPPTPIGSPGLLALRATADPAKGDDLYFVAGDDGLIYFGKTEADHQKNIEEHCQVLCKEL